MVYSYTTVDGGNGYGKYSHLSLFTFEGLSDAFEMQASPGFMLFYSLSKTLIACRTMHEAQFWLSGDIVKQCL